MSWSWILSRGCWVFTRLYYWCKIYILISIQLRWIAIEVLHYWCKRYILISIPLRWIAIEVLLYLVYDCVALVLIPFFTGKTCKPINKK